MRPRPPENNPTRCNTRGLTTAERNIDPRIDGASDAVLPSWPVAAAAAAAAHESDRDRSSTRASRCKRVHDDLMKTWKEARFAAVPKPRSTHPRQAQSPRQRKPSFSSLDTSKLKPSWGNLGETMSSAAHSAWREQLVRRNLCRLAGLPVSVLRKQDVYRAEGSRIVTAAPSLTAVDTARMVVEGTCPEFHPFGLGRTHASKQPVARVSRRLDARTSTGSNSGGTACGGGDFPCDETAEGVSLTEKSTEPRSNDDHGKERERMAVNHDYRNVGWDVAARDSLHGDEALVIFPTLARPRDSTRQATVPRRGFHLVDLHAVVRNSIEWRHCLSKVEPCFRVGDNRDRVLLGLIHALGGRLTCSSAKDLSAASEASRGARPGPSPPPRMLDRHVCRSPTLLRASVVAGVRLYEVDCADELDRIREAHQKANTHVIEPLEDTSNHPGRKALSSRPEEWMRPSEILVRLALPFQSTQKNIGCSTTPALADSLEMVYGASVEDVVEIAIAAAETRHLNGNDRPEYASYIVGFSIDVGRACWNDRVTAASLASGGNPCVTSPAVEATGEAVASATLARNIDLAVSFAVETARRAAEEVSVRTELARASCGEAVDNPASLSPPFTFRRLHVTGLGEGGARGEPLSALKSSLSRHLPVAGTGVTNGADALDRPIVVTADATEYLMANGVWSTVAAVIGRKRIAPVGSSNATRSIRVGEECISATGVDGCSPGETARTGSAMYYIDDGCYGSLSGSLLRGVQVQPYPILSTHRNRDVLFSPSGSAETARERAESRSRVAGGLDKACATRGPSAPCTVWGPTCDGLDCVSRITPLPVNLRPGRDWLLFQDVGIRGIADATTFNGFRPLDCFYCLPVREGAVPDASPVVPLEPHRS